MVLLSRSRHGGTNLTLMSCEMNDENSSSWCIRSRVSSLLRKDLMSDVTFFVGDPPQRFPCHKLILGIGSQVFQTMFYGDIPEKDEVFLPDISPEAFVIILQYLYSDEASITTASDAFDVAYASKKYLLNYIFTQCEEYLLGNVRLTPENVCSLYEESDILDMKRLRETCLIYIAKNFTNVYHSGVLTSVTKSTLADILKLDFLEVESESIIFEILWNWGTNQCEISGIKATKENLRSFVGDLFKYVRILSITGPELEKIVKKYDFLDTSEEMSVLLNIALPRNGSYIKMLTDFSSMTRRRTISDCYRIDMPLFYRFNDTNSSFCEPSQKRLVTIEVANGQLTVLGVVLAVRPTPGYSRTHRKLVIDIQVESSTGKVKTKANSCLKPEKDEVELTTELFFEDIFIISDREKVTLVVITEGEGIQFPQMSEEQVLSCFHGVDVVLNIPKQSDGKQDFVIKQIMCV